MPRPSTPQSRQAHTHANAAWVFAKHGRNQHGRFEKGDRARGAYSPALMAEYIKAGILIYSPLPGVRYGQDRTKREGPG